jgi:predicted enzyme related to lactoylglutathione lyase
MVGAPQITLCWEDRDMSPTFSHVNLIAADWRRLARFYEDVFGCTPATPERDLSGEWLDRATGLHNARITGVHLLLPGGGADGPTLELFQYDDEPPHPGTAANRPGFGHIAFEVDDVEAVAAAVVAHGGALVGELTRRATRTGGQLTFQYVADPEGNIIELAKW